MLPGHQAGISVGAFVSNSANTNQLAIQHIMTYVAAGPSEASRRFETAKLLEGAQQLMSATNVEDWATEQCFTPRPGDPVVLVAPNGAARDRAAEVLSKLVRVGTPTVSVSDQQAPRAEMYLFRQGPSLRGFHESPPPFHSACSCPASAGSTTDGVTAAQVIGPNASAARTSIASPSASRHEVPIWRKPRDVPARAGTQSARRCADAVEVSFEPRREKRRSYP
jgi:hypothetical protein